MVLFISPPFGNYINLPKTISIRGSFTLEERQGKWIQILKTLRYSFILGGWVNKIGLRNPGISYAINTYKKGEIISIAIMDEKEIKPLVNKIPEDMDIELNVSCPNTEKHMINKGLKLFLNSKRKWCIIKLPPNPNYNDIDRYYKEGFRQFHASNTLSTLNTAVIVQNGGSGSIGKLKDLLSGRKNSNAKTSNPDGLKALHKFNDRMKKATERKETSKKDHFSFLNKEEIPEWQTTNSYF